MGGDLNEALQFELNKKLNTSVFNATKSDIYKQLEYKSSKLELEETKNLLLDKIKEIASITGSELVTVPMMNGLESKLNDKIGNCSSKAELDKTKAELLSIISSLTPDGDLTESLNNMATKEEVDLLRRDLTGRLNNIVSKELLETTKTDLMSSINKEANASDINTAKNELQGKINLKANTSTVNALDRRVTELEENGVGGGEVVEGPQGPKGERGPQGEIGPVGPTPSTDQFLTLGNPQTVTGLKTFTNTLSIKCLDTQCPADPHSSYGNGLLRVNLDTANRARNFDIIRLHRQGPQWRITAKTRNNGSLDGVDIYGNTKFIWNKIDFMCSGGNFNTVYFDFLGPNGGRWGYAGYSISSEPHFRIDNVRQDGSVIIESNKNIMLNPRNGIVRTNGKNLELGVALRIGVGSNFARICPDDRRVKPLKFSLDGEQDARFNLDMEGISRIQGLPTPVGENEATSKTYVDTQIQEAVSTATNALTSKLTALLRGLDMAIGTLVFSHNNPNDDLWLPFGVSENIYNDSDYPELAALVKTWGEQFRVVGNDNQFKLGDISDVNRYLFAAGGNRPSGSFMSSQLPNIKGEARKISDTWNDDGTIEGGATDCFEKEQGHGSRYTPATKNNNHAGALKFNASRSSSIYQDGVNQVFGDSFGVNLWIKAKMLILP